jgi:transmembrane sensor
MNSQIIDEAAEWFVTMRNGDGDAAQRARFAQWLLTSPEHVRTYLELTPIWAEAASVNPKHLDAKTLIARARLDANVVDLHRPADAQGPAEAPAIAAPSPRRAHRFARRYWLAASLATVAVAGIVSSMISRPTIYTTGIGEQRSVGLSDGSRIELNSQSRLQVRFSKSERAIDLLEGQGLFDVASDPRRPFIVRSDDTLVRAVGTQFDVYRKNTGTVVTVIEGRVEIGASSAAAAAPALSTQLGAGEQATIATHRIVRAEKPNVEAATAWTQRRLVFDAATLETVAAEFNRYNFKRLVVRDTDLNTFRISGVFSASDPASLVQFLKEQPEITLEQSDTEVIIAAKIR